jgi:ubiquinone/menaquinone biosynthesis C-methylase UbiE
MRKTAMSAAFSVTAFSTAALVLAAALSAQVATNANAGYQTPDARSKVAKNLADPKRDQQQRPALLMMQMGLKPGMQVADVGTGVGHLLPFLSKRVGPQGHVIGEDIFDDFLKDAKDVAANQNLTNVTFIKGEETDPKLPEGQLDMVLAFDVYHHFNYPEKMLAGIYKGLRADGKLVVVEYYKRETAMPNGAALTHIRLDMPDLIKELEANRFHLVEEMERIKDVEYMLILEKR